MQTVMSDSDDDMPLSNRATKPEIAPGVVPAPVAQNFQAAPAQKPGVVQASAAPSGLVDVQKAAPQKPPEASNAEAVQKPKPVAPSGAPSGGFSRDKFAAQPKGPSGSIAAPVQNNIVPKRPVVDKPALNGSQASAKPVQNSVTDKTLNGKPAFINAAKPSGAKPEAQKSNKPHGDAASKPVTKLDGAKVANPAKKISPTAPNPQANGDKKTGTGAVKRIIMDDSDSEDDVPLNKRVKPNSGPIAKAKPKIKPAAPSKSKAQDKDKKRKREEKERSAKKSKAKKSAKAEGKAEKKWDTLHHCGVLFPPDYVPHGVKMLYDGRPVELTPEQEEVASMYGIMIETDYAKKKQFNDNFWTAFRKILGKGHVIQSLGKCDFRPMYEHFMAERELKKAMPKEEKVRLKEEKDAAEAKYKVALVDGKKEGVGNFRVEPPGLFRGRGEHPKMGQLKRRIYPRDITINIGKGQPIPDHPYPGQKWAEIRHDNTVTWLAFWKDPISTKDYKYVWLAANSSFKSDSDLAKYEKARKLKDYVDGIRERYRKDWQSGDTFKQQMGVALYFIDKLALRAGHEKDEDEADTVGCCTLKVENVECMEDPKNHIKFDFLGKDSIRYENEVEVDPIVWKLVKKFCKSTDLGKSKKPDSQVFETLNATDLNNSLKDLMDGLSVKVFRTYNASITLDRLLYKDSVSETIEEKKADYDRANKEVAILCNHQRAVPKGHTDQMERLGEKLRTSQEDLDQLTMELKVLQGKEKESKLKEPMAKGMTEEKVRNRITKKKEQLAKLQVMSRSKEDLKTVALGTSKINYLDPRITIAWCKRQEVPIEKIFNKSLITKFHWAMDSEPEFKF